MLYLYKLTKQLHLAYFASQVRCCYTTEDPISLHLCPNVKNKQSLEGLYEHHWQLPLSSMPFFSPVDTVILIQFCFLIKPLKIVQVRNI